MSIVEEQLRSVLARFPGANRYLVAFSGGLDSSALLHATASVFSGRPDIALQALHVHHGLHDDASHWTQHCREFCEASGIAMEVLFAELKPAPGESIEAEARQARYRLLKSRMQINDVLLMAHHGEDQLETLMLRLMRGAGVRGLAGMPESRRLGPGLLLRPLLELPRAELARYAREHRLEFLEDPSNQDTRFDRGYLRENVLEPLRQRWPGVVQTAARSAKNLAAGSELLDDLGALDLDLVQADTTALSVTALLAMSENRRKNVLRFWIRTRGFILPSSAKLEEICKSVMTAAHDAGPCVAWPGAELRRYRDRLYLMSPLPEAPVDWQTIWDPSQPLTLPARAGRLCTSVTAGPGLDASRIARGPVSVRFRSGGERLRIGGRAHHTSLSRFFQEQRVVPWMRERVPLVYIEGQLAAVADLCLADGFGAKEQGDSVRLAWQCHPPINGL